MYHHYTDTSLIRQDSECLLLYSEFQRAVFNGNKKTISNFKVYGNTNVGLFGVANNALIYDLFISNKYGSFVFIGEIVTDQLFEYNHNKVEACLKCGKCSIACPNNAIDGKFHKERCLSYLNQRPSENFALYDKMLYYYGCDICQNVCPMNKNRVINGVFELDNKAKINLLKTTPKVSFINS